MSTVERRRSPVSRQVEAYEEAWQRDPDAVPDCATWADTVAVAISTGLLLEAVDHAWRERVFRGTEEYDAEANDTYRVLFSTWLRVTDAVLDRAAELQVRFGQIGDTIELRQLAGRLRAHLAHWEKPRLALAVGLRADALARSGQRIASSPRGSAEQPAAPSCGACSPGDLGGRVLQADAPAAFVIQAPQPRLPGAPELVEAADELFRVLDAEAAGHAPC